MFTGIIEATAEIVRNDKGKLTVQRPASFDDLKRGSSVCVAGACLTVTMLTKKEMAFDVVPETLARTTLGSKKSGDRVNLERAMRADGRFDGHVVQGHVEGVGVVVSVSSIPLPLSPGGKGERPHRGLTPSGVLAASRRMRKDPTEAEEKFWEAVREDRLGVRVRRQYRFGCRIVDFYIPSAKLVVELDGDYHFSKEQSEEDDMRMEYLEEAHGIRIIRFHNDSVLKHLDRVLDTLRTVIRQSSPSRRGDSPSPPERGLGGEGGAESLLTVRPPSALLPYILPKGSITLDGVSLTIIDTADGILSMALIPATLRETTLGSLAEGDRVNVETDILGRYVRQFLSSRP